MSKTNKLSLRFMVFMFFYQIITTLSMYFPPLLGVIFCAIVLNMDKENKNNIYLAFVYLVFIESLHNFYIFSSLFGFFIFYYNFATWLKTSFKFEYLLLVILVSCGYLFTLIVNLFLSYVFNESFVEINAIYIYYIFIESLIAIVFFKGRTLWEWDL